MIFKRSAIARSLKIASRLICTLGKAAITTRRFIGADQSRKDVPTALEILARFVLPHLPHMPLGLITASNSVITRSSLPWANTITLPRAAGWQASVAPRATDEQARAMVDE